MQKNSSPHMDSLAANGIRFEAAYSANPICQPSEQLFDLEQDHGELRNLAMEEAARGVLDEHRRMLNRYIETTNDTFPLVEVS